MKTFTFDQNGNLTVVTTVLVTVGEGDEAQEVEQSTQQDISPAQLAVHLPMLIVDMPPETLLKAQEIIKGLAGV